MLLEASKRDPFKINGVVVGVVVDNRDPKGHYRVKVKFPWVSESGNYASSVTDPEDFRSTWCRLTSFMAGSNAGEEFRGAFFLPEVDDEVLLAFEHGDLRRPYVIGSLWNGVDKPIHDNESQEGENNYRSIRSREGHMFQFVDNADGAQRIVLQNLVPADQTVNAPNERDGHWICLDQSGEVDQIEIYDHTQEHYMLIDTKNKKITIETTSGDMDILAKGTITMKCEDLVIEAKNNITASAGSNVEVNADSNIDMTASGNMTLKGSQIDLNP